MRFVREVVLEHALKRFYLGKHGEEQGVQVTSHATPVLRPQHIRVWIVGHDDAGEGFLLESDELNRLFNVAFGIFGREGIADVFS